MLTNQAKKRAASVTPKFEWFEDAEATAVPGRREIVGGSTVAPKMFSQPGVFGTSDTTAVVNKTNPMAGLAAISAATSTQSSTVAMLDQARNPTPPTPVQSKQASISALKSPVRMNRPVVRNRIMEPDAAFLKGN